MQKMREAKAKKAKAKKRAVKHTTFALDGIPARKLGRPRHATAPKNKQVDERAVALELVRLAMRLLEK